MQSTTPVSRSAACELNWWRCIPDTLVVPHLVKRVGAADVGTSKSGVGTGKVIHAILFFSLTQTLQLFSTSSCPRRTLHQLSPCKYISIPQVFCRNFHCLRFKFLHFFFNRFFSSGAGWPNLFPASLNRMPRSLMNISHVHMRARMFACAILSLSTPLIFISYLKSQITHMNKSSHTND